MIRMHRLLTLALLITLAIPAGAQEFLDTAGRWKSLPHPQLGGGGGTQAPPAPRAMVAHRGHVVVGREARGVIVSRDSGETWSSTGSALPAGVTTVWALGIPDTAAGSSRIVGVAAAGASARLIETTDGGTTWRDAGALPDLDPLFSVPVDTMRLYGPPQFLFVPNVGAAGRTGFNHSAAGLLASTDDGRTWSRRGEARPIRAMAMADALNGIAAFGDYTPSTVLSSTPGGIYWTSDGGATWTQSYEFTDGGFYQHLTFKAFSPMVYRAFVPERFQNYMDWRLLRSSDGGRSWGVYLGRQAKRPLYGVAFWRDTADIHVVADGAILSHAADGGEIFYVLRDTARGYWQTPLDLIPGYVTKAPVAATDGRYLYFTVPGDRVARWRMASIEPFAAVEGSDGAMAVAVAPNPVRSSMRVVVPPELGAREILIVDVLGRERLRVEVPIGSAGVTVDADELLSGRYVALVRGASRSASVGFVVD
jgi:photosystem II stability/assembly factor-like uncharacterized protein